MGPSLNSRDDRHTYVGYVFQSLDAFVMNLAPNARICDIPERRPIDINNKLPAGAGQDHDFVRSILRNPIEGIDKLRVSLCGHNERSAFAVEFNYQHAQDVSAQPQTAIGGEISRLCCIHVSPP